jgi:flagellar FliJ protein
MKSRDALIRLKRFDVDEKQRKVAGIEAMIADFNEMAVDLDRQIAIEQERAGITDVNHYAYPTFAKAAIQRRDNLAASASDLEARLAAARAELEEACSELRKIELMGGDRDTDRVKPDTAGVAVGLEPAGAHRVAN